MVPAYPGSSWQPEEVIIFIAEATVELFWLQWQLHTHIQTNSLVCGQKVWLQTKQNQKQKGKEVGPMVTW